MSRKIKKKINIKTEKKTFPLITKYGKIALCLLFNLIFIRKYILSIWSQISRRYKYYYNYAFRRGKNEKRME